MLAYAGRRVGAPVGSYISDLASLQKSILLCGACVFHFNPRAHHYFREQHFHVQGDCDACRNFTHRGYIHFHESLVGKPERGRNTVWTPRNSA
jgi:hypothetical protein